MDADDTRLDDELREHARRSLRIDQVTVDPDHELATFNAKLENEHAVVRVGPSVSSNEHMFRWWPAAAAVVAVVLVGAGVLAVTRDGGGQRIGSPSSTIGDSASPTSGVATTPSISAESSTRDSTPRATTRLPAFSVGGGFNILTYPKVAFADNPAELTGLLSEAQPPIDVDALGVGWDRYAVVVFARPTDACPSVFAGITVDAGVLTPVFANPGYDGCNQPLLSHTVFAAIDRDVLAEVDWIELPAISPFFDTPISIPISATPSSTPRTDPSVPDHAFGAVRGTIEVPDVGDAQLSTLDDGSPIIVVHHHDDTITAMRPWTNPTEPGGAPGLVTWIGATRTFLGNSAWDEYGRRLDGPRSRGLITYATRVVDDRLEIGDAVALPAGAPIGQTTQPAAAADLMILPDNPISLADALALPAGETRWIDASVVIDPTGAHLCKASGFQGSPELAPCPADAAAVEGVEATPEVRTVWFGPVLAARTATGFTNIVPTGGYASSVYGKGLPPPAAP